MKIALGSISPQKLKYLKKVLADLKIVNCKIILSEVKSNISEQPLTSAETLKGSINRAKKSFAINKGVDFSVGIEVGYELNDKKKYEIFCWATIYYGLKVYSCKSNSFLLPEYHQDKLKAGLYLSDFVRKFKDDKNYLKNKLGLIIKDRDVIIKNAIFHVLIYFLNKKEY